MLRILGSFRTTLILVICLLGAFLLTRAGDSSLPPYHPLGGPIGENPPAPTVSLASAERSNNQASDTSAVANNPVNTDTPSHTASQSSVQPAIAQTQAIVNPPTAPVHISLPQTPAAPGNAAQPSLQPLCVHAAVLGFQLGGCVTI